MYSPVDSHCGFSSSDQKPPPEVSLVLAQLNQETAALRESTGGRRGRITLPLLLIGMGVLLTVFRTALPSMRHVVSTCPTQAKTATELSDSTRQDMSALTLNATCITGRQRLAVINGRVYQEKDSFVEPKFSSSPCVVVKILPDKVLLNCRNINMTLGYSNTATAEPPVAADSKRDEVFRAVLPAVDQSQAGAPSGEQIQGMGLETMLNVLSGIKK